MPDLPDGSPQRIVRTEEFYLWDRETRLTPDELNRRFIDLHLRLQFAETEKLSDENLRQEVGDKVLIQSEAVIAGLRDKLLALTRLDWLTATSSTPNTLIEAATRTFSIPPDQRELFTPGPYVMISREGSPDVYAVARTQAYDRETGLLDVTLTVVVAPEGGAGPWADWDIGALAGSTLTQINLLAQAKGLRDQTVAARNQADQHRADAASAAGAAGDARDAAAGHRNDAASIRDNAGEIRDDAFTHRQAAAASAEASAGSAAAAAAAAAIVNPELLDGRLNALEAATARGARSRQSWFLGA